jgi:ribA/ribD-fused uncharacterized protein
MRAAPIGLARPVDVDLLRNDAALSAVVTHADPTAVLSAVAMAYLVADLLHTRAGELDIDGLLTRLHKVVVDLPDPAIAVRKPGGGTVRLLERLLEMGDRLDQAPAELFAYTYNGALVTESLPAALWCFLRSPNEPERVLVTAVNQGHDADTVAAMAGAMAGACNGAADWPDRWLDELGYRDGFEGCADDLLDLAGLPADPAPEPHISSVTEVSSFSGPFAFLSNSARTPIEVEGLRYPTVEHAYSSLQVADEAVAAQIRLIPTPSGSIERRRRIRAKPDWVTQKIEVMAQLLAAKFAPGERAASQLIATGKATLRNEVWWDDSFWGVVNGAGENRLGRMLEELRNRLA